MATQNYWLGFMAYQPLLVIKCQILFSYSMYIKYVICKLIFLYTQLKDKTVLFLIIQFSISHLFALYLNVQQFYLTHRLDPIRSCHSRPKLQHYSSLTIHFSRVLVQK